MTTERIDIVVREDGSRVVKRNLQDIGGAADNAATSLDFMRNILTGLIAGGIVTGLVRMADTFTNMQNRLRLVTTGTENLTRVTKELLAVANDTRSDFTATAELYARLATSSKELGVSQEQMLKFTKTLNQAIVLSGASAEEAAGGLRQLSQGMASGTLRGDELNSVMENFPKVADIIAQGLGVTRGELRKMGAEGKITAQDIIAAFQKAEKAVGEDFAKTVPTVGQSLTVLRNNFTAWIGDMNQSLGITQSLSKFILMLSENLDTLVPVLAGIGVAIATAFAPLIIAQFASAIKGLWVLMAANPFVAVAAIVAGLVTTLYMMRDAIKLGIDDTTTLGDLMRAAWEALSPIIDAVAGTIQQIFINIGLWSKESFGTMSKNAADSGKATESTWLQVLRAAARTVDAILGLFIGLYDGIKRVFSLLGDNISQVFTNLGAAKDKLLEGEFKGALEEVGKNQDVWKDTGSKLGAAMREGLDTGFAAIQAGGFEAKLDSLIDRAQQIGKDRAAAAAAGELAGAAGGGGKPPVVDPDAAKKAARELQKLKNALDNVLDAADPVGAATRRLAEAQDILTRAVKANLIEQDQADTAYKALAEQMYDQIHPLEALNKHLDENISLLKLSNDQRQIEGDILSFTEQLRRDGVKMTEDEVAALRAKLQVEQELARISQYRDSMDQNSSAGQMKEFMAQLEAFKQFSAEASTNNGDRFNALKEMLPWANLENTQEQMAAYVQLHADMYAQIKALEDQGVINHQTAEMLKAQADVEYSENRLSYQRKFFGLLAGLANSENSKLAAIGKAAAVTQAVIDGVLAVQKTMAETPYPYNIPLAAAQGALAAANVAQIVSQPTGFRTGGSMVVGGSGGPDSQLVALRATPGEHINVNTPSQARALEKGGEDKSKPVNLNVAVVDDRQRLNDWAKTPDGQESILYVIELNPERIAAIAGNV